MADLENLDWVTVLRLRRDRSEVVAEAVELHHKPMLRFLIKHGASASLAEDIAQETWSLFLSDTSKFRGHSKLKTYLFGIAFNKLRESWRYSRRFTSLDSRDEEAAQWADPEDILTQRQRARILCTLLEELPMKQRQAFWLREFSGRTTESLCQQMKISAGNLGVLIYRARTRLSQRAIQYEMLG